jgi:predicted kinase
VPKIPPRKHCLILVVGVAGSGKTTLARTILSRVRAVYLDNNHIVDAFFPDTRSGRRYEKLRPRFYRALYTIVEENLRIGNSVLLDVPHIGEIQNAEWRRSIRRLASRTESQLVVIRCFCSEGVLQSRIRARAEKRDRQKLSHWKAFTAAQPILGAIPFPHLDIDTEKSLRANTRAAICHIRNALRR